MKKKEHSDGHGTRVVPLFPEIRPDLEEAWPKLFVNLRASRETEPMRSEPAHVVHAWLGNSREVAEDHYLMVTDDDFERASKGIGGLGAEVASQARSPASRTPDQSVQVRCNPERSPETKKPAHPADREVRGRFSTPTGSRISAFFAGDTAVEENSGPNSGPLWVAPDVGDLVRLLADLPEGQRQALVSLMRHAAGGG